MPAFRNPIKIYRGDRWYNIFFYKQSGDYDATGITKTTNAVLASAAPCVKVGDRIVLQYSSNCRCTIKVGNVTAVTATSVTTNIDLSGIPAWETLSDIIYWVPYDTTRWKWSGWVTTHEWGAGQTSYANVEVLKGSNQVLVCGAHDFRPGSYIWIKEAGVRSRVQAVRNPPGRANCCDGEAIAPTPIPAIFEGGCGGSTMPPIAATLEPEPEQDCSIILIDQPAKATVIAEDMVAAIREPGYLAQFQIYAVNPATGIGGVGEAVWGAIAAEISVCDSLNLPSYADDCCPNSDQCMLIGYYDIWAESSVRTGTGQTTAAMNFASGKVYLEAR